MQKTEKTFLLFFLENGLHGILMYILHFIHIRYHYKRKRKLGIIINQVRLGESGNGNTGASLTTGRTMFPVAVFSSAERATASVP